MLPRGLVSATKLAFRVCMAGQDCTGRLVLVSLLFIIFAGIRLPAQTFSLVTGREPVTSLDGLWRFQTGDDPAWAIPARHRIGRSFARTRAGPTKGTVIMPVMPGIVSRFRFRTAAAAGLVAAGGRYRLSGLRQRQAHRQQRLHRAQPQPVFASFRQVYDFLQESRAPSSSKLQFASGKSRIWARRRHAGAGQHRRRTGLLTRELSRDQDERTAHDVSGYGDCLLASLVGLTTLVLFFSRLEDREYFWFSVLLLAGGAEVALDIIRAYVSIPTTSIYAHCPLWRRCP